MVGQDEADTLNLIAELRTSMRSRFGDHELEVAADVITVTVGAYSASVDVPHITNVFITAHKLANEIEEQLTSQL